MTEWWKWLILGVLVALLVKRPRWVGWRGLLGQLAVVVGLCALLWLVEPYGGALCVAWLMFDALWLRRKGSQTR